MVVKKKNQLFFIMCSFQRMDSGLNSIRASLLDIQCLAFRIKKKCTHCLRIAMTMTKALSFKIVVSSSSDPFRNSAVSVISGGECDKVGEGDQGSSRLSR